MGRARLDMAARNSSPMSCWTSAPTGDNSQRNANGESRPTYSPFPAQPLFILSGIVLFQLPDFRPCPIHHPNQLTLHLPFAFHSLQPPSLCAFPSAYSAHCPPVVSCPMLCPLLVYFMHVVIVQHTRTLVSHHQLQSVHSPYNACLKVEPTYPCEAYSKT